MSIAAGIVALLASITLLGWYVFIYEPPSCADGVQNQDERGVDCEGVCALMCVVPRVDAVWSRAVLSAEGVYHGVALIKNPEPGARGTEMSYSMSLYDSGNILVAERRGTLDLAPGETRVLFEPNIITRERVPVRTLMKIDGGVWERAEQVANPIRVLPGSVDEEARTLVATIENTTSQPIGDVVATALLYDREGVLITASQTTVPTLPARGRQDITFTWSLPFERPVTTSDIVVRHDARP